MMTLHRSTWMDLGSCYYSTPLRRRVEFKKQYAPIRIQCVNALVNKEHHTSCLALDIV